MQIRVTNCRICPFWNSYKCEHPQGGQLKFVIDSSVIINPYNEIHVECPLRKEEVLVTLV